MNLWTGPVIWELSQSTNTYRRVWGIVQSAEHSSDDIMSSEMHPEGRLRTFAY